MSVHTQSRRDGVTHAQPRQRNHSRWKRFTAAIGAIALGFAGLVGATAAHAVTPDGISVDVLYNGAVISDGGTQNIPEGDLFQLRVSYNTAAEIWGQEIKFTIPENITLPGSLPSNPAVEGITDNRDGTYTVKFWDDAPDGVGSEGAFVFNFRASEVEGESSETIRWESGDDTGSITIVVEDTTEPEPPFEDRYAKSVSPGNLNGFVITGQDSEGHYYFDGLDAAIVHQELTYTLVLASAEGRTDYEIADVLGAGLGYVADSFEATLDPAGDSDFEFNPTITGNSFSGTVTVPAESTLTITYKVKVTDVAALEAALEAAFDDQLGDVGEGTGNYWINVRNTATFGDEFDRTADVYMGGNVPGVGIGDNFGKSGNWTLQDVVADEDGTLVPAAEMTYTLRANLAPWDERNSNFKLTRNVVITDTLIEQAEWKTGDSDFITVHPENGDGLQGLTQATSFTGTAAEFADDAYVGQWAIVGKQLLVNVGQDNETNLRIDVKAQMNTVDGLIGSDDTTVVGGERFPWNNRAQFHYRDGDPENRDFNSSVVVIPDDYEGGIEDSSAFNKTSGSDEVQVQPGQSAEIPYNFRIDTSKGQIDPLKSTIVDTINTNVFDVSDVSSIPVTGNYAGTALTAEHFDVSLDGDDLVIVLSEAGKTLVEGLEPGAVWNVDIILTTVEFDGKETFEIYNSAKLIGEDTVWDYVSDDETEATSFGNEAEIRKRVYDQETGEWVSEFSALIEGDTFVNKRFVYSIEVIPRGNYGAEFPVSIFTRVDDLPGAVDFIGFTSVDENGAPILDSIGDEAVQDMNGNIEAAYDAAERTVTIAQKPGTSLNPSQRIITYFAVDANDASDEIVNSIDGSSTNIKPYGDPSIDIEKWNTEGDERPEYDESGALLNDKVFAGDRDTAEEAKDLAPNTETQINFTISNDGRENLRDIVVSDELTGGAGVIADLTCDFSPLGGPETGTEWEGLFEVGKQFECVGTLPGLAEGDAHANLARVDAVGEKTGIEVEDEDEWHARVPVPSIDVEKWNVEGDEQPEYDETGALLNDKEFAGDRDTAEDSKALAADTPFEVNFTISNDGEENLVDIVVSDELTDGVGVIEDLTCDFGPLGGPETGTEWEGVFEIGTQFQCVGTLPALSGGDIHADLAKVEGVGEVTGIVVGDEDEWHAHVPQPSVGIEKWTDEGETPEYDASGALLNDGYAGDFDKAPGKKLEAGKSQVINFTITNDGPEALLDVVVSDSRTGGVGDVQDLLCVFPDGSEGTSWDGPFEVGVQFECTGILPGLEAGESHADEVTVSGVGAISGIEVGDADEWHGYTDAPLSETGSTSALWIGIAGGSLLLTGLALVLARRRMIAE